MGHHLDIFKGQSTHSPSWPQALAIEASCLTPCQELLSTKDRPLSRSHFLLWAACIQWLIDMDYQDPIPSLNITERASQLQGINWLSWGLCCSITVHLLCPVLFLHPLLCDVLKSIGPQISCTQIIKTQNLLEIIPLWVCLIKGPYSQSYGFSSSHVWMWELDHKESWVPKNWYFWTVVLEKTLEKPLSYKEID